MAILNQEVLKSLDVANIRDEHLVVGVSGGPDSQALLSALVHVGKQRNLKINAVGINHGLRAAANSELDLAEELARNLQIQFERIQVKVKKGASLQANARDARYEALFSAADRIGARFVVTGHHYDDRAETVLFRLLRGKNFGSLGVLPVVSGRVFRPLLKVSKDELLQYCSRWNLKYAQDPSNQNCEYTRVKIRKEIMPLLEGINPQIKQRLNDLADEAITSNIRI